MVSTVFTCIAMPCISIRMFGVPTRFLDSTDPVSQVSFMFAWYFDVCWWFLSCLHSYLARPCSPSTCPTEGHLVHLRRVLHL